MKKFIWLLLAGFVTKAHAQDAIYYAQFNHNIQQGQFDGTITIEQLKKHGDFAIGSTDKIGTELVMLDGKAWSIAAEKAAVPMPAGMTLPFAAAKFFKAEQTIDLQGDFTLASLQAYLDSALHTNRFAAIRITATFDSLTYKCFYPQQKPYPPIAQAKAKFFDSTAITGTIAGFFTPKSMLVINNPNYHFHFINAARTGGGHVEKLRMRKAKVEIDYADEVRVFLPDENKLKDIDLNKPVEQ